MGHSGCFEIFCFSLILTNKEKKNILHATQNLGWGRGQERSLGEGLCLRLTEGQRGLCVFVGGQRKKAVYEAWCGLETGCVCGGEMA